MFYISQNVILIYGKLKISSYLAYIKDENSLLEVAGVRQGI
jgi:hypothetical protein